MKFTFNKDFRKFKAGETVEIPIIPFGVTWVVGSNSSGKSTLMKLLRHKKDSLTKILNKKREGYIHEDTDIKDLKPDDVTIEIPDFPHMLFLDAVADDPTSLWNSASAYSYLAGGGATLSRRSKGEKSFAMLSNFLQDAKKVISNPEEFLDKDKNDENVSPDFGLIVLDEVDEGMDLKNQVIFSDMLEKMAFTMRSNVVCITHSILIPIVAGAKEVFDMDTRSVVNVDDYMKRITGKDIKITVSKCEQ